MTTSDLMEAMSNAGAPFEAILIAIRALEAKDKEIAAREAEAAEKRAKEAARKKEKRGQSVDSPDNVHGMSVDKSGREAGHESSPPTLPLSPNDNNSNPHTPTHPDNTSRARKGVRLSPEWQPNQLPENVAALAAQWPPGRLARELEAFRDYWLSRSANAAKSDWDKTWHNRIRDQHDRVMRDFRNDQRNNQRTRSRHEPDGAMAYLQRNLGLDGDSEASGAFGRYDDGEPSGGYLLPGS